MIPDELMWAIGLFEGEGCISNRSEKSRGLRMKIAMTDEDVVRRFHRIVGTGYVVGPYQYPEYGNRRPYWVWHAHGPEAETVLRRFLPELGERRKAQAFTSLDLAVAGEHIDQLRIQVGVE